MARHPANRSQAGRDTLGRLGGLAPTEADRGERALWLAGPGYRAALFHLGALTRLNELGLLARVGTVGAVSGGSILAALLATRVPWPLQGAYRDWPEQVAEPLRRVASRNARARAFLRRPLPPGSSDEAALEERYARELVESLGGESAWGPRFVFGASGLTLSGLAAGWEECLEWDLGETAANGYDNTLVSETISAVRTDLDAFGEGEQAVLENHGYLLADAAVRAQGLAVSGGIEATAAEPPHPRWMGPGRVREALAASGRRTMVGRLRPRRQVPAEQIPEPAAPEMTALLQRYRPVLQYDSLESGRADAVSTICSLVMPGRSNSLHRSDGTLIASAAPGRGEALLDVGFLRGDAYPNGEPVHDDDYLDECGGSHADDALAIRGRDPDLADVVYGRARRDREGALWLQYWLFFYYGDKGLLGIEGREGDWQMLQLQLDRDGDPEAATFAQHGGAERLRWDQLELALTDEGQAPVVYLARGGHAPRPRPGSFAAPFVADHNDGLGPRVRPRLSPIGDDGPSWVLWPGRWGSTRRREYFEADSPYGPRQHPQWWDPAELHDEARGWTGETAVAGEEAPPPLRLQARLEGALAIVSYAFGEADGSAGEPARIVAAPIDGDGGAGRAHCFAIEGDRSEFALQLPDGTGWEGVRAAVTSTRGVAGETVAMPFAVAAE